MKRHDPMISLTILNVLYTFDLEVVQNPHILRSSHKKKSVLVNTYVASNL